MSWLFGKKDIDENLLNVLVEYYITRMDTIPTQTNEDSIKNFYKFYGFEDEQFKPDKLYNNKDKEFNFVNSYTEIPKGDRFIDVTENNKNELKNKLGPAMFMYLHYIKENSKFITELMKKLDDKRKKLSNDDDRKPYVLSHLKNIKKINGDNNVESTILKLLKNEYIQPDDWKFIDDLIDTELNDDDIYRLEDLNRLENLKKITNT